MLLRFLSFKTSDRAEWSLIRPGEPLMGREKWGVADLVFWLIDPNLHKAVGFFFHDCVGICWFASSVQSTILPSICSYLLPSVRQSVHACIRASSSACLLNSNRMFFSIATRKLTIFCTNILWQIGNPELNLTLSTVHLVQRQINWRNL